MAIIFIRKGAEAFFVRTHQPETIPVAIKPKWPIIPLTWALRTETQYG